ncbi:uncharacterized protein LOC134701391 [Mytilus trossulus]|uniref:uncharacterized protein LOC134701391 n=1 Tax=Mytilus trossulus TaxID=6551 RepID=UPI003004F5C8
MATSLPICDICTTDDTSKAASVWCSECEEAICINCEKQHNRMKLTKSHKTISIEDYQNLPASVADIKQECKVHNRKLDFYCLRHSEPCCVSCVSQKHDTCKQLKPLTDLVDDVKSSAAFEYLEDRAKDISDVIGNLIKDKQDNKANIELQKNKIVFEVQNVKKAILDHLDKLQTDLLYQLDSEEKRQCKLIGSFIEKISEIRRNVDQIVDDLKQIKQHASDFQAFLGIHEWNQKIEKEEKDWMSFKSNHILDSVDIRIEYSPIIVKFEKDVKEIGRLEVKSFTGKKILLKKEKQGQILVSVSKTVDNIKLTNICSFHTPEGQYRNMLITGVDIFDDGRIVLVDNHEFNHRLVITNKGGKFIKNIHLDDRCFGVAVIEKDTVASTLVEKKKIVIVDIESSKLLRSIPTNYRCFDITFTGEQLVVSLEQQTIQFFDFSGKALSSVSIANSSDYCSVFNDQLYYTSTSGNRVYSTDLNGEVRWTFDLQKSDHPSSITHDTSGNIFVACWNSNQLEVVELDGKKSKILLTKEDGLLKPTAIQFNRKSNTLIVCNISGQCFLYKVTN